MAPRLREIKRNEINNSSLNLTAAKYRYASELGVNFHNSKLVYTVVNFVFQVFSFSLNKEKKINRLWPDSGCYTAVLYVVMQRSPHKIGSFLSNRFLDVTQRSPKKQLRGKLTFMGRSVA